MNILKHRSKRIITKELLDRITKPLLDEMDWKMLKIIKDEEKMITDMEAIEKRKAQFDHRILWYFYWKKGIDNFWKRKFELDKEFWEKDNV